jgi:hypothetical protein
MLANPPSLRSYGVALWNRVQAGLQSGGGHFAEELAKFANRELFFAGMICEKSGRSHKSLGNIGRKGAFFQKGGFQKNDVKSTIDFNLSSGVWETGRHEHQKQFICGDRKGRGRDRNFDKDVQDGNRMGTLTGVFMGCAHHQA